MTKKADDLQTIIKEISIFINSLNIDEITPSVGAQPDFMGKIFFAISSIDESKIQTPDNIIILEGDNVIKLNDFKIRISKVLSKKKNFSKDYVDKILWRAIALKIRLARGEVTEYKSTSEILTKLFNEPTKTYKVFIEIEGFFLNKKTIITFGKTKFYIMTESRIKTIILNQGLSQRTKTNKQEVEFYKGLYLNKQYSEIIVNANDNKAAVEKANIYLNRIMSIINYFSGVYKIYNLTSGHLRRPRIKGNPEMIHTHAYTVAISKKAHTSSAIEHYYDIHLPELKKHRTIGKAIKVVNDILFKDETNSLHERILTSLQWAGIALWENKKEIAFTNYITSLEALLLLDSHTELSYRLNLFASHIVGKDFESRNEIFNKLKHLYEIRSKIVHTGIYEIEDDDLNTLKYLVINILLTILLDKKYLSCKDIDNFKELLKNMILE